MIKIVKPTKLQGKNKIVIDTSALPKPVDIVAYHAGNGHYHYYWSTSSGTYAEEVGEWPNPNDYKILFFLKDNIQ